MFTRMQRHTQNKTAMYKKFYGDIFEAQKFKETLYKYLSLTVYICNFLLAFIMQVRVFQSKRESHGTGIIFVSRTVHNYL
jgi:hypothetical protein